MYCERFDLATGTALLGQFGGFHYRLTVQSKPL